MVSCQPWLTMKLPLSSVKHSSCNKGILEHFWPHPKNVQTTSGCGQRCPRIPLLQLLNSFGDTFWPNHTLISSKSSVTPMEFLSTLWTEKKIHQIWGMAWPGPGFSEICAKKLSLIHTPNFSTARFWIGKTSPKLLKLYFFVYLYKMDPKGKNEPNRGIGKELLRVSLMNQFQQFFANPVLRPKRYIRVPEIKIRKAEKGNQRTRGDAWIEGWGS